MKAEKKITFALIIASAAAISVCAKDASDGLVGWWRVEQKADGTVFQPADLRDHVHAGSAALSVNHATANDSYTCYPVCHTNLDLTYPLGSGTLLDEPCLYIPQPTNTSVTTGNAVANNQNVVVPLTEVDFSTNSSTFVIRFCPNTRLYGERVTPTVFSYDWSSTTGIRFALKGQGSRRSTYPYVFFGGENVIAPGNMTILAGEGRWYDVGVVVEPNVPETGKSRVMLYMCDGNGFISESGDGNKVIAFTNIVDQLVEYGALSSRRLRIGSTAGSNNWGGLSSGETLSSLLIHQVKVYDRALSVEEFEQTCAPYSDPLFSVGSKNGSADEFSNETAEDVYVPFEMPWWKLRKTLTADNPSLSIKTSLTAADKDVSRILEFTPFYSDDCPSDASIEVQLNGTTVAVVHRNAETDRLVHLNGKTIERLVSLADDAYPLTLTLKRTGGMSGSISFDRISLGGGWQLGKRDGKYGEFRTWEGNSKKLYNFYRYFLARQDIGLLAGQMYMANVDSRMSAQTLCFSVSDALAKKGSFVFKTNPLSDGEVEYYLNGDLLCSKTVVYDTDYEIEIPNGLMKGGINELRVVWISDSTSSSSTGFDYMRLSPRRFPRGSIYVIR